MKAFSSKILLFGEHIVNKGAHALAIPFSHYYAQLSFDKNHVDYFKDATLVLQKMYAYIKEDTNLRAHYNLQAFKEDLDKEIGLLLTIPVGYGLGSSGAIVAAVYHQYGNRFKGSFDKLKQILGETESVFHGKSSGLDPLVSYLKQSVLIDKEVKVLHQNIHWQKHFSVFLLDTKTARKTAPLVNGFLDRYNTDNAFKTLVDNEIIPLNNRLVHQFVKNDYTGTLENIKQLSALQLENYGSLILDEHRELWQNGLDTDAYYVKICGAGGGGFMLAFSKNEKINVPLDCIEILK